MRQVALVVIIIMKKQKFSDRSTEIYVCRKSCMGIKKFIKDEQDKECVSNCPENNNFIKKDSNQCVSKCGSSEYFQNKARYLKCGSTSLYYNVSECLASCPTDQGYFYVKDNGVVKKNVMTNAQLDLILLLIKLKTNLYVFQHAHQIIHFI